MRDTNKSAILVILVVCALLLGVALSSCNVERQINESDANIMDGLDIDKTDNPENTDDTGGTEDMGNADTIEDVEQRKQEIIQIYNDNAKVFDEVMSYFEAQDTDFYCKVSDGELIVKVNQKDVDISEIEIAEQITYIINELGFEFVLDVTDYVQFNKHTGIYPYGSTCCQGLLCNKKGTNRVQEERSQFGEQVRIADEWFYYMGSISG